MEHASLSFSCQSKPLHARCLWRAVVKHIHMPLTASRALPRPLLSWHLHNEESGFEPENHTVMSRTAYHLPTPQFAPLPISPADLPRTPLFILTNKGTIGVKGLEPPTFRPQTGSSTT